MADGHGLHPRLLGDVEERALAVVVRDVLAPVHGECLGLHLEAGHAVVARDMADGLPLAQDVRAVPGVVLLGESQGVQHFVGVLPEVVGDAHQLPCLGVEDAVVVFREVCFFEDEAPRGLQK